MGVGKRQGVHWQRVRANDPLSRPFLDGLLIKIDSDRDISVRRVQSDGARDRLTGLASMDAARETMRAWLTNAQTRAAPCIIHAMLVSLQRIDTVNVAFGERAGDGALIEVARRISHFAADEFAASGWVAARVSGGAFLIASLERCSAERWQWLAEALADAVALPVTNVMHDGSIRLWPRITLMRAIDTDADLMLDRMANGFVESFEGSARRIAWVSGTEAQLGLTSARLESDLLGALDRDEIEVVFQPQYDARSDRLIGAEALARWKHPEIGLVGASTLFTIAERADHVAHLSRHITDKAMRLASVWPASVRLSVNITSADLAATNLARELATVAESADYPLDRLTIEITEQIILSDLDQVGATLEHLRRRGARIALDDFGAGFCNFRYLKILPLDYLKLDRTMVEQIDSDPRDLSVFRGIVAMAKALGLRIIAEGVQNAQQKEIAAHEGCEYYQGFLKSEPLSPEAFLRSI